MSLIGFIDRKPNHRSTFRFVLPSAFSEAEVGVFLGNTLETSGSWILETSRTVSDDDSARVVSPIGSGLEKANTVFEFMEIAHHVCILVGELISQTRSPMWTQANAMTYSLAESSRKNML